jgi:ABC-type Zn uptake system ZnuABC Zn-binding protein ZnuA
MKVAHNICRHIAAMAIGLTLALVSAGCARAVRTDKEPSQNDAGTASIVVTTVAPITSIVKAIAGDDVVVRGIIPEGEDSHTYEPRPQVAIDFSEADLIFFNGLHLETPAVELAEKSRRPDTKMVFLAEETITPDSYVYDFSFPKDKGDPNPHLWLNPIYAARYAEIAADELARVYPAHAEKFKERYGAYSRLLFQLDEAIFRAVATIPPENRKLLTYHDSFAYFAPRYGFQVIGAIQPSDFSEPSAAEVAAIIDQIRQEKVPAIFGSEVFPSPVMQKIAQETGARYVTDLSDDTLPSDPQSREHNYVGMMVRNVETITQALGGDPSALREVDVSKGGRWA